MALHYGEVAAAEEMHLDGNDIFALPEEPAYVVSVINLASEVTAVRSAPDELTVDIGAVKMPGGKVEEGLRLCGRITVELLAKKNISVRRFGQLGKPYPFGLPTDFAAIHQSVSFSVIV